MRRNKADSALLDFIIDTIFIFSIIYVNTIA